MFKKVLAICLTIIIISSILLGSFFLTTKVIQKYLMNNTFKENESNNKQDIVLQKELLTKDISNCENLILSVNRKTKLVLFTVNGEYYLSHDKTKSSNSIIQWFTISKIGLKVSYSTCFAIDTDSLEFEIKDETVWIYYNESDIYINSIEINNSISDEVTALFGKKYNCHEVLALEEIAKQNIKSICVNDLNNITASKSNLITYLNNLASSFNVDIIICKK